MFTIKLYVQDQEERGRKILSRAEATLRYSWGMQVTAGRQFGREIWAKIRTKEGGPPGAESGGVKSVLGMHGSLQMVWIFTQAQGMGGEEQL